MFVPLLVLTALVYVVVFLSAWKAYKDVFHPLVLMTPMFAFMYVYMPGKLVQDGRLFLYLSEDQSVFVQTLTLVVSIAFFAGCFMGSKFDGGRSLPEDPEVSYSGSVLRVNAYRFGTVGLLAWMYGIHSAGGFTNVFGQEKGMGWSDLGYVREADLLTIVAVVLLLSPEAFSPKSILWKSAVAVFAGPYLIQGLLGAQRGPTFIVIVAIGMSWYLARYSRPPLMLILSSGAILGFLLLFLVVNRSRVHLGSDFNVTTDLSGYTAGADASNEYIFGAGCIIAGDQAGGFYWGRRYFAQVLVRPIPRQIWPDKYADVGLAALERNGGLGGQFVRNVMGWTAPPGAAGGFVADAWVEFYWLTVPFAFLMGWLYGRAWALAVWRGGSWNTIYTICVMLSLFLVSQGFPAVLFRFCILAAPTMYTWRAARCAPTPRTIEPAVYLPN